MFENVLEQGPYVVECCIMGWVQRDNPRAVLIMETPLPVLQTWELSS